MGRESRVSASSVVDGSSEGHLQRLHHPQSLTETEFPQCHLCTPPSVCSVLPYFAASIVLDWGAPLQVTRCSRVDLSRAQRGLRGRGLSGKLELAHPSQRRRILWQLEYTL